MMRSYREQIIPYARGMLLNLDKAPVLYTNSGDSSYLAAGNAVAGLSQYMADVRDRNGYYCD